MDKNVTLEENKIIKELLNNYSSDNIISSKKLIFCGIENKDVYNITSPVIISGKEYILGRVESRESETDSKVLFFKKIGEKWEIDEKAPILNIQDPFLTFYNNEIILCGVEVKTEGNKFLYRTLFYRGIDIYNLVKFAEGPFGMKDIRLVDLSDGLGIFTRPQGAIGGRGRIGFFIVDSIEIFIKLKGTDYLRAPLLNNNLSKEEWMGVNAICHLKNGKLGILGHIAYFSNENKNYYPIVFSFDYKTKEVGKIKIIVRRKDLPNGASKRKDSENVLFPGGLIRNKDETAKLYLGVSDTESYEVIIKDPFLEYEH